MKQSLSTLIVWSVAGLWVLVLPSNASAQEYVKFGNIQGEVLDQDKDAVPDGFYPTTFRLWDAPTLGNELWSEADTIQIIDGLFNFTLGTKTPFDADVFSNIDPNTLLYLEITFNGESLSPRFPIVSAPYSKVTARILGDIETGPGELVFTPITPPDLPTGIVFKDSTGDTMALYGPGGAVFLPVTPPDLPIMASYGPGGVVFQPVTPPELPVASFHPVNGIMFADTGTGDTMAQYGSGEAVLKSSNPDLAIRLSPAGVKISNGSIEGFDFDANLMVFTTNNDTVAQYGPGEAVFTGSGVTPDVAKYGLDGIVMTDTTGDLTAQNDLDLEIIDFFDPDNTGPEQSYKTKTNYGVAGLEFLGSSTTPNLPVATLDPLQGIMFADTGTGDTMAQYGPGEIVMKDAVGSDYFDLKPRGIVFGTTGNTATHELGQNGFIITDTAGDTTARIESQGKMNLGRTAGASQVIELGDYYRDNAIVAWGRVAANGTLSNDFGVASAVRDTTGSYTITLDASASLPGNLITLAVAELEALPTTAASARMLYVNQAPGNSVNSFNIYITNGSFAATDNDFMFMVTAR